MNDAPKSLKWVLFAALFGAAAYVILPYVLTLTTLVLQIMVTACAIGGLWLLLPALSEWVAQIAYVLWAGAIGANPTARLRRDLRAHAEQITAAERGIADSDAQLTELRRLLLEQAGFLAAEERMAWENQIADLVSAGREMVQLRDDELRKHQVFERQAQRLEANWKIGKAFKGALKSFSFKQKTGLESDGAKVAMDRIHRELAESQSRLRTVLSRKQVERQLALPQSTGGVAPPPYSVPATAEVMVKR